ncbi:MAG: PEP-CTERM sorting domain-containing protein [Opitutales bacterium]|nr:PEP-CTERM sorting domain-containing protein [Opitutales bacterium]
MAASAGIVSVPVAASASIVTGDFDLTVSFEDLPLGYTGDKSSTYMGLFGLDFGGLPGAELSLAVTDVRDSGGFSEQKLVEFSGLNNDGTVAVSGGNVVQLGFGDLIDSGLTFQSPGIAFEYLLESKHTTHFAPGDSGYVGVNFISDTGPVNGWVHFEVDSGVQWIHIGEYGWDSSGGSITAGAIPEPSTFAAVAGVGALAWVMYRKRRRSKAAVAAKSA